MRTTAATRIAMLALLLAAAGTSRDAGATGVAASVALARHELSADMASLVPADAVALLVLQSSAAAAEELAAFQPQGGDRAPLDLPALLMRPIGLGSQRLDPHRPLAVALSLPPSAPGAPSMPMMAPPIITYVLPVADLAGLKSDLAGTPAGATPLVEAGDYVGISMMPGYAASATVADLARELPDRTIVLRLKAARLVEAFRPVIDMGLTNLRAHNPAMARPDSAEIPPALVAQLQASQDMQAAMLEHTVQALSLVPMADLALGQSDGQVQLDYALQMLPGARKAFGLPEPSPGLVDLARCLPQDMPIVAIYAADFGVMADMYEPWFRSMATVPPTSPASTPTFMTPGRAQACVKLMRLMGPHTAAATSWGDPGMVGVAVCTASDPQAYVDAIRAGIQQNPLPWLVESVANGPKVEGRPTLVYTMKLDAAALTAMNAQASPTGTSPAAAEQQVQFLSAMLGKDGLTAWMATLDDKVVTAMGPDTKLLASTLKALKRGKGDLPAPLQALDAAARDQLCTWGEADLREVLLPLFEAMQKAKPDPELEATLPKLRAMPPTPLSARVFATDNALEGSCRVDIAGVRQMIESFPHPKRGQAPAVPQPD